MTITSERRTGVAGELRHINKWYGSHHVLTDVSVRVDRRYNETLRPLLVSSN